MDVHAGGVARGVRLALLVAGAALAAGCAAAARSTSAGPAPDEAQGVIRAAEALFAGMETRDTAALRRLFAPEARVVSMRVQEGVDPVVQTRSASEFIASIGRSTEVLRERIWAPRVEVRGNMAALWAPYLFHLGERFSHCGVDAFHFVRTGGAWRIVALTYTVQPESCEIVLDAR